MQLPSHSYHSHTTSVWDMALMTRLWPSVWDMATGKEISKLEGHSGPVYSVTISRRS